MLPIIPFLIIAGAYLLIILQKKYPRLGAVVITLTVSFTILWGIAFMSIYTTEQTRITASRWIYNNIPSESKLLGEHWDDGLPIPIPPQHPSQYEISQLPLYDKDDSRKKTLLASELSTSDYIIINSRRLYGTLANLPEKYPLTSIYYKKLFSGELGYEKIEEFSSYPQLLGIEINDDSSEETFQVYDHPKVLIFKNTKYIGEEELIQLLK